VNKVVLKEADWSPSHLQHSCRSWDRRPTTGDRLEPHASNRRYLDTFLSI